MARRATAGKAATNDTPHDAAVDETLEFEVEADAEILEPPSDLRRKAKGRPTGHDEDDAVAAAEAALARMASTFDTWMSEETERLAEIWASAEAADFDPDACEDLYRAAHDIKGQAATLGFPIAGRVAASLCRLLDGLDETHRVPRDLVRQHVQSVRAIIAEDAREATNATATRLADRLDEVTDDYLDQIAHAA